MTLDSAITLATERIVEPVEETHRAIARRWFGSVDSIARPVSTVHDVVANIAYRTVRFGGAVVGTGIQSAMTLEADKADSIQAFVNGLWGDNLGRHEARLAIEMGVQDAHGRDSSNSSVTGRIVVLVHGLGETEACWRGVGPKAGLAEALEDHPELTPVSIRYNTGLRVSANGSQLATLLESIHSDWPVPVESVALVGHSMGGLVIRSACSAATAAGQPWVEDVDHVVALGSPHRGAPLEKLTNVVSWVLNAAPETRPLASFLNARSGGIKDLRFGAITESDWKDIDPDALLRDTVGDHPLPPDVAHHFVAGVVTANPMNPIGAAVGDLVVRVKSGTGARRLNPTSVFVLGGVRHGDLLRHSGVVGRIMTWLSNPPV